MNKETKVKNSICLISDEDWFNLGKSDARTKRPKNPPDHDSQAASIYELGYCDGESEYPSIKRIILK